MSRLYLWHSGLYAGMAAGLAQADMYGLSLMLVGISILAFLASRNTKGKETA